MITCIAIDDEPLALKQMEVYIEKTPILEHIASFESALEAYAYLGEHSVDLLFIDIQMPDLTGLDFVRSLTSPPMVVFTTAHSEYAVEGFKVSALDYLVKPIAYPDFLRATHKARLFFERNLQESPPSKGDNAAFVMVKSGHQIVRINLQEIKYIEGMREYLRIHLDDGKSIMTLNSMKKMLEQLPSNDFMRVHRSYIVRLDKITTIERSRIVFDQKTYIPVSKQYQDSFQDFLRNHFLN